MMPDVGCFVIFAKRPLQTDNANKQRKKGKDVISGERFQAHIKTVLGL